ncbi:MAG: hypothetical protein Q9183_004428, partial [Haloplaca sp. 2 TL-2023]
MEPVSLVDPSSDSIGHVIYVFTSLGSSSHREKRSSYTNAKLPGSFCVFKTPSLTIVTPSLLAVVAFRSSPLLDLDHYHGALVDAQELLIEQYMKLGLVNASRGGKYTEATDDFQQQCMGLARKARGWRWDLSFMRMGSSRCDIITTDKKACKGKETKDKRTVKSVLEYVNAGLNVD